MINLVYTYFTHTPTGDGRGEGVEAYIGNLKQAYDAIGFDARITNPRKGFLEVKLYKKEVKKNEELHDSSKD